MLISSCGSKKNDPTPPPTPPKKKSKAELITLSAWAITKHEYQKSDSSWVQKPLYANQVTERYTYDNSGNYTVTPNRGPFLYSNYEYAFVADSTQIQIIDPDFHYEQDVIVTLDEKNLVTKIQKTFDGDFIDGKKAVIQYNPGNGQPVEMYYGMRITYDHHK